VHRIGSEIAAMAPAQWLRPLVTLAALALGLSIWAAEAEARFESALRFDGTGIGMFSPLQFAYEGLDDVAAFDEAKLAYVAQPTSPAGTLVGLFSRPGLIGGFSAGFLGAGVLGLFFGHGVAGGLTGVASALGLIFQLALVVMLARLIWVWWRGDKAKAFDNLSPRQLADAYGRERNDKLPDVASPAIAEMVGETEHDDRPRPLNT
jgi:hypothetical protein